MSNTPPDHIQANSFLEWLSAQWFFLVSLVVGAGHAATAQSKITRHDEQLKSLEDVPVEIASMKQTQQHHGEMLKRILDKLDK